MKINHWRRLLVLCLLFWQTLLWAQTMRPFVSGSLEEIMQAHKQQDLLLVFWSGECPPCMAELKMLSQHRLNRPYQLVLVSVDGMAVSEDSLVTLQELGISGEENWAFADGGMPARLFFSVDPSWQGELPRSEYFTPEGRHFQHIGKLTQAQIDAWAGIEQ